MKILLSNGALSLVLLSSLGPLSSTGLCGDETKQAFPETKLTREAIGKQIPLRLAHRMTEVAAWYEKSQTELTNICMRDQHIRADRNGRLFYADEPLQPEPASTSVAPSSSPTNALLPASETFRLHSRAGTSKVIYLDFDGHTTSGTSWNTGFTSGASFTTPPYDSDGTPGSFSSTELTAIQRIWQRVAEDYAPWDVDVTTEDPGVEALRKSTTTDSAFGVRICVGGSSYDWFGSGAGGVAYVGSYNWSTDTPGFVFPAQLGNGAEKYTAEAISHEAGHTLGLHHDGTNAGSAYYAGHGNWAPIMGVGYYKDIVQWSRGEYPDANNTEDDTSIINRYLPLRQDTNGGSISTATTLSGDSISASGIIEQSGDVDLFKIDTGAGPISLAASAASPSGNVDLQLALYNGSGSLITFADQAGLSATLDATVTAGTYYVGITGVGAGDTATGYSNYGSIGQFSLTGTLIPQTTAQQPPVAVADSSAPTTGVAPLAVTFTSNGSYDPDGSISEYLWDFGDGSTANTASAVHSYSNAGTYTATLLVRDNDGLTATDTVTVKVTAASTSTFSIANITLQLSSRKGRTTATSTVTVLDPKGSPVSNVTLTGAWSGLASNTSTAVTNRRGQASFASSTTTAKGTFTFTVAGAVKSGMSYTPESNLETTDSISTP